MPPFLAHMASEQVGHPLKLNTCLLALTGRLYRTKWHIPLCSWYAKSGTLHTKKIACLQIFHFLVAQRATGQRRTLVQVQRDRLKLPARRWKRKWRVASCSWYAKLGSLHTEKIYLLANLLFVRGAKGDGAILPSFSTVDRSIDAPSSSMKAPIATHHIRGGCKWERFHNGKQIPVCRSFIP